MKIRISSLFGSFKLESICNLANKKSEVDLSMKKLKLSFKHILLVPLLLITILLIAILAELLVPVVLNPMRRPAPMIRNHVLRLAPIGTCIEDVIEIVENNERWGAPIINRESGFSHPRGIVPDWPVGELRAVSIVGNQNIRTSAERYSNWLIRLLLLGERSVRIFWGFDEDGKLIEVYVDSTFSW